MKTADEIPVGFGFLGSISDADWNEHWRPGKPIAGSLIRITVIRPGEPCGSLYLRDLLKLHAGHLPGDSQLSNRRDKWLVGVRETRSKNVKIIEWDMPRCESYLEELHRVLIVEGNEAKAVTVLGNLWEKGEPFL